MHISMKLLFKYLIKLNNYFFYAYYPLHLLIITTYMKGRIILKQTEFLDYLRDNCNIILTQEQKQAVFLTNGASAVVAVPGSGKTLTLCVKTANLILNHNIEARRILVMTFSKASANDMENKFKKLFGHLIPGKVKFATIHSFAYSVLRDYSRENGFTYTLIEAANNTVNKYSILKNLYQKYNSQIINKEKLEEVCSYISYIKNIMIEMHDLNKYSDEFPVNNFDSIYREYEDIKETNNLIDYDDMMVKCYEIIKTNKNILHKYSEFFNYYLLDEAQDTSLIQHEIVKLLVAPSYNISLFFDDDQAIYSWRGVDVNQVLDFKKTYKSDGIVLFMQQNFRSTQNIVEAANEFIKLNKSRYTKNIYTSNDQGIPIKFYSARNEFDQMDIVIDEINKFNQYKETAVLFRNNLSVIPLAQKLAENDIPFYLSDCADTFFRHWISTDILNIMKFSSDMRDIEAFSTFYYKIKSFISKKDILSIKLQKNQTIFQSLIKNQGYPVSLLDFQKRFEVLSKLSAVDGIKFIENELNYSEYLKSYSKDFKYSMDNIDTMLSTLKITAQNVVNISEFKSKLILLQKKMISSKKNANTNAVSLRTLHSSKGLEYGKTILIDLIQNVIPDTRSIKKAKNGDHREMEEATRLFYVGITRAKESLVLIYPKSKNSVKLEPSVFYTRLKSIVNFYTNKTNIKLVKGLPINHKSLGVGLVLNVEEDVVTIEFTPGIVKKFSIRICMENDILTLVS